MELAKGTAAPAAAPAPAAPAPASEDESPDGLKDLVKGVSEEGVDAYDARCGIEIPSVQRVIK